ncbi:hypothetical protein H2200_002465 [Cladophialophora chaetospira]|uniref:Uncharacterized protein n=1 Tax=Cladophialophora chaetospira TaxID=386627 RepID=A0AA38XJ22_9EURO|nr:hypothetical protein H2200_002465 [Cladophialophora chaetospira]
MGAGFTWLTNDPALVNLEQLLSILTKSRDTKQTVKTIVVFVTPSLAPLIESGDFGKDLFPVLFRGQRSSGTKSSSRPIRCIYAVVDALPSTSQNTASTNGSSPRLEGTEGLAIFLSSSRPTYHLPFHRFAPGQDEEKIESTPAFAFASNASSDTAGAADDKATLIKCHVRLPVANTIFVNGQRATFFEDVWKVNFRETEDPLINYISRRPLAACQLNLACDPYRFISSGSSPLQQLTQPRKITGSMGNILAQIEVDGTTVPASQELERAVPAYIASNPGSTMTGPILVYALICPEAKAPVPKGSIDENANLTDRILAALWQGAKLFKVSGGGGGWGTRQGLLSLEAAVNFEGSETASSARFPDFDSDRSILEEFGSRGIIPKSSTVEFLVHSASSASTEFTGPDHVSPVTESDSTTVILGTTTDPESHVEMLESESTDAGVRFLPNHFGMISYGGLALSSITRVARRPWSTRAETRLDVPDSYFIFRDVGKYDKNSANVRRPTQLKSEMWYRALRGLRMSTRERLNRADELIIERIEEKGDTELRATIPRGEEPLRI